MKGSRIFGLRLDDETRTRWEAAAAKHGLNLSEFIKQRVEDGFSPTAKMPVAPSPKGATASARVVTPSGGKVCKGPDPKPGKK